MSNSALKTYYVSFVLTTDKPPTIWAAGDENGNLQVGSTETATCIQLTEAPPPGQSFLMINIPNATHLPYYIDYDSITGVYFMSTYLTDRRMVALNAETYSAALHEAGQQYQKLTLSF